VLERAHDGGRLRELDVVAVRCAIRRGRTLRSVRNGGGVRSGGCGVAASATGGLRATVRRAMTCARLVRVPAGVVPV
jgi:hypothetical protein